MNNKVIVESPKGYVAEISRFPVGWYYYIEDFIYPPKEPEFFKDFNTCLKHSKNSLRGIEEGLNETC